MVIQHNVGNIARCPSGDITRIIYKMFEFPGDALESPAPSPQHGGGGALSGEDMHSRLELYASRLAQVELGAAPADTPDR